MILLSTTKQAGSLFVSAAMWAITFLFLVSSVRLNAQDIIHPASGTSTVSIASGSSRNYYDPGGAGGNYANNQSGTLTLCPTTPGELITLTFNLVDIEASSFGSGLYPGTVCCYDGMTISDSNGTLFTGCGEDSGDGNDACGSTQGENGPNDLEPGDSFTSTAADGCLTVFFSSDNNISETGWAATVSANPLVAACTDPSITGLSQNPAQNPCPTASVNILINGNLGTNTEGWFLRTGSATGPVINGPAVTSQFTISGIQQTTTYFVTANNCSNGGDAIASITITTNGTAATAGPDHLNLAGPSEFLAGSNPSPGTGLWTEVAGDGNGTFGDATSPTSIFSGTPGVTYTLRWTVTNSPCVTTTDDVLVSFAGAAPLTVSITAQTNVTCYGGSDGSATAAGSGGAPPYSYTWDAAAGGQTTATATGLIAGTYMVSVTDADNAVATTTVTITEPTLLEASIIAQTNVSCASDGTATVAGSGGTPGYSYLWDANTGGQTTATATGLFAAGTYCVTVTDANFCISVACANITVPTLPEASITAQTNVSCNGGTDGTATVAGSGGNPPYTYLWNNAQQTTTATSLDAGLYCVTVTDANLCISVACLNITEPTLLEASITAQTNVSCPGGNDGTATVAGSGGTLPYTYLWDNGQQTTTATGLDAGLYCVTVTDANLCISVACLTVTDPPSACCTAPEITDVTSVSGCPGDPATITVTGSLNDATEWVLYSDECGGNAIATSTDGTFQVPDATATYYVRGEGGCVTFPVADPLIWEEQFDGEIPATWALSSSPAGAVWAWSANGDPFNVTLNGTVYTATYYPQNFATIGSPSAANGSAMFNADAYSTNGTFDTTGGPFPGAHTSSMTSPSVDCSGQSSVFVRFYQYTRLFQQATITLSVSTDDGGTWTDFTVANNFFFDNLATTIDISSVASNQADVKLRFTWSSNTDISFYFGIIDDVQLRSSLDDASGAIGCTEVTVVPGEDNTAPSLACTDLEVTLGTDGTYQITSADLLAATGASDACGILGYTLSTQTLALTCDNVGTTPVTITVEDNNGLTAACTVNQIVTDGSNCNHPPDAVCQTVTINADANCQAEVTAAAFDGGSTDLDMDLLTFVVSPEGPYALGTTNVTLTVSDGMAMSQCMTTVTVVDNTQPNIGCFNQTINLNGEDNIPLGVDDLVEATDNCGVQSISLSPNSISSSQVGQTIPVVVTVTDVNGNSATCTSQITVGGLPSGWSQNVNGVGCTEGNDIDYNASNGTWTATSTNCYYTPPFISDAAAFAQYSLCGNGSITAQVTGISGTSLGWAGVVMRESNDPGAKKAQLTTNMSNFSRREFRTTTNGTAFPQQFPSQNRRWLRIVRSGNQFIMYVSPNGVNWAFVGVQNIQMSSCIEIGLVATNYSSNSTVTASFANVSVVGNNPPPLINDGASALVSHDDRQSLRDVKVYPNPTSGQLNIALTGYEGQPVTLEVYNTVGQLLYTKKVDEVQNSDEIIDLSSLANGIYLIRVSSVGLPNKMKRVTVAR